jgi:two-component system alkaline phosphatase synthesis response regulator PhoP
VEKKAHILIVEDEPAIHLGLSDVFVYHGYEVTVAEDGAAGLALGESGAYDLILLDIMLPKMNGFEVCERIREQEPEQPIIMLTARVSDNDIVQGLRLGADDYIAKPFSVEQLVLRVAAVLRRAHVSKPDTPAVLQLGSLEVDVANLCGTCPNQETVHFTRREMDVLVYLAAQSERPVPREEILANVWGYANHDLIETRTVDINIAKLRKKIEDDAKTPQHILTIRGAGYRLMQLT